MPVSNVMKKSKSKQEGFTLIEVLMGIMILSIGIFALSSLQTFAIQGNASASRITESTAWASGQAEQIYAMDYDDLQDNNVAGDLDEVDNPDHKLPDNDDSRAWVNGGYSVVWNVEEGPVKKPNPDMTKKIRVIVYRNNLGSSKRVSYDYLKMKLMN